MSICGRRRQANGTPGCQAPHRLEKNDLSGHLISFELIPYLEALAEKWLE